MATKLDDNENEREQSEEEIETADSPFNIYNTEIVKLDARSATMTPNGDLVRQSDEAEQEELEQFALVEPEYELSERPLLPRDSVTVVSVLLTPTCRRILPNQLKSI